MDPYQSCPCGSGKGFKWCCQPFFHLVEKARQQHGQGQHESALRSMEQLVKNYPGSAPALGYQAEMLLLNGKPEEADESLQKALSIQPDFPLGHWLRGVIRKEEGEIVGALNQFRKAAELYDPKSVDTLAEIHAAIFDIEMRMNRPIAARASLEKAIHCDPAAEPLREAFKSLFGPQSRLPECARKGYSFRAADPRHADAWKAALPAEPARRVGIALAAFDKLITQDASDAAAQFNLGLIQAWLGENSKAIESLRRFVELETDEEKIVEAGALIEVLLCGEGLHQDADYLEYRIYLKLQQSEALIEFLSALQRDSRLSGVEQDPDRGILSALILEETPQFGSGVSAAAAKLGAYVMIVGDVMKLWHSNADSVNKVAAEVAAKLGSAVASPMSESGHATFTDITLDAMLFPTREVSLDQVEGKMKEQARSYFEDTWIHRPLKALSGVSPMNAVGHPGFRKRLLGVIRFLEDCVAATAPGTMDGAALKRIALYDFDRLRRILGLAANKAASVGETNPNIDDFSVAELTALETNGLDEIQLDRAFRASLKLDARELAGKFARRIVRQPASAALPDRYPYFNHLIQTEQAAGDPVAVMSLFDEAEKADAASNDGRRQNDYALRRGQLLAKRGDGNKAYEIFQELLAREPNELKYYGPATESMLGQKEGAWALQFAEKGLEKARSQNNRDSEQYFLELAAAAKKIL